MTDCSRQPLITLQKMQLLGQFSNSFLLLLFLCPSFTFRNAIYVLFNTSDTTKRVYVIQTETTLLILFCALFGVGFGRASSMSHLQRGGNVPQHAPPVKPAHMGWLHSRGHSFPRALSVSVRKRKKEQNRGEQQQQRSSSRGAAKGAMAAGSNRLGCARSSRKKQARHPLTTATGRSFTAFLEIPAE